MRCSRPSVGTSMRNGAGTLLAEAGRANNYCAGALHANESYVIVIAMPPPARRRLLSFEAMPLSSHATTATASSSASRVRASTWSVTGIPVAIWKSFIAERVSRPMTPSTSCGS